VTSPVRELDPERDTFPKLAMGNAERIPQKVAIREKDYGIWQSYTWAEYLAQALGGVPVPLYQDSIEKEMQYIIDHAEANFAIVEDQEQVDKLLNLKEQCPRLEYIIYDDPRGLRTYTEPFLLSLERLP